MRFEVHRNHLENQARRQSSVRLRLPSMGDGQGVDWVDDVVPPFQRSPFVWSMGVRPLELDHWLVLDDDLEADRILKSALLRERHDDVVAVMPGSEPAAQEVLDLVTGHLIARGIEVPAVRDGHPIERAARIVQEDLVLLERDAHDWRMTAACVCFPTRWDLASKRGRSMAEIHSPVPRYDVDLSAKADTFFDRLHVDRPVWRTNWTIDDDHGLRLEPNEPESVDRTIAADNVGERLCLRLEYQTLRRLPEFDSILFTIRIVRRPLQWVVDHDEAGRLLEALAAMPDDVAGYKSGSVRYRPQIVEWLTRSNVS